MTEEVVSVERAIDLVPVKTKSSSWNGVSLGIGFTILPVVMLLLGYLNVNPGLWRNFPAKSVFERSSADTNIAWTGEQLKKPPLEFVREKFAFVSLDTEAPKIDSFWNLFVTPPSKIQWAWEYEVKNLTSEDRSISVSYYLIDENGMSLVEEINDTVIAQPDQTVTLKGEGTIPYGLVRGVKGSGWSIR
jgi:hypothetical protein